MICYDLCLTWSWKCDVDFASLLETACQARKLAFLQITPESLDEALTGLASGGISFAAHFDCSAHDARFEPLFHWARERGVYRINPPEVGDWAEDKATMHLELISAGVHTPYTIILPPFNEQPGFVLDYRSGTTRFEVYKTEFAGTARNTVAVWRLAGIRGEVGRLRARGVDFEEYDFGPEGRTVGGILAEGESDLNAWFTDSEGNILALAEDGG